MTGHIRGPIDWLKDRLSAERKLRMVVSRGQDGFQAAFGAKITDLVSELGGAVFEFRDHVGKSVFLAYWSTDNDTNAL
jgi:hypothetical protein